MTAEDNWECGRLLAAVFGRAPDLRLGADPEGASLGCWRDVQGHVELPSLPQAAILAGLSRPADVRGSGDGRAGAHAIHLIGAGRAEQAWRAGAPCDLVLITVGAPPAPSEAEVRRALEDALGAALLRQILAEVGMDPAPDRDIYVASLLRAFAAHIRRGAPAPGDARLPVSASSAYRLHKVLDAIRHRPGDAHAVEDMAASVGLTADHFSKVFKSAMGVPPRQYLLKVRVEHAVRLMADTRLSLAEISETLGFASQSHFNRVFRAQTGQTPSAYRQRRGQVLH